MARLVQSSFSFLFFLRICILKILLPSSIFIFSFPCSSNILECLILFSSVICFFFVFWIISNIYFLTHPTNVSQVLIFANLSTSVTVRHHILGVFCIFRFSPRLKALSYSCKIDYYLLFGRVSL